MHARYGCCCLCPISGLGRGSWTLRLSSSAALSCSTSHRREGKGACRRPKQVPRSNISVTPKPKSANSHHPRAEGIGKWTYIHTEYGSTLIALFSSVFSEAQYYISPPFILPLLRHEVRLDIPSPLSLHFPYTSYLFPDRNVMGH